MNEDERLIELWRESKSRQADFSLHDFLQYCHEWDAICEKFRRSAGRE